MSSTDQTSPNAPHRPSVRHSQNPCLSPDGRYLAAVVVDESGYPHIVQRRLSPGEDMAASAASSEAQTRARTRTVTRAAEAEQRIDLPASGAVRHISYSPDGRWLACEVAPDGGERGQIWLVATDDSTSPAYSPDRMADATVQLVCWDGDLLAHTAIDSDGLAEGRLASPTSDAVRVIDRRMGGELIHVRDEVALFRVGSRGTRELLCIQPDGSWSPLLPPDSGSTTDRGFILDSGRGKTAAQDGVVRALVRSDHSAERARLLEVRLGQDGTHMQEVAARTDADLDALAVSLDSSTAALLWNHHGATQIQILDLSGESPVDLPAPQLPTAVASSPSLTADGRLLTMCVEAPEFPPRVVLWDVVAGTWVDAGNSEGPENTSAPLIGNPGPLAHHDASKPLTVLTDTQKPTFVPELVQFNASDGLELTAWVYRAGTGPRPTWVYFHGGPEGQSRPGYNNVLRQAVDAGYTVVAPNVRGSAGQGRAFSHADERYARLRGIDDVADTVRYLVNSGISDGERMAVGGRSYGGYLTLATLVRHRQLWRGGVAACGMSDLETFYRDTEPWIAVAAYPKYGHPLQERELLQELSPIHDLGKVDVPVLFVHGANDTNVPVNESQQAFDVLRDNGTQVDFLLFDDEGHEFVKRANRHLLGDRVEAFLQEVLS